MKRIVTSCVALGLAVLTSVVHAADLDTLGPTYGIAEPHLLTFIEQRLRDKERGERAAKEAAQRKSLIGSGDRSDRIRTYNFPQGRLTDHRINLTLYKLGMVMDGDLDEVIAALQAARAAEQLAALESGENLR